MSAAISITSSFAGGFTSFFSVWQACIMQLTPFYLAFITALYFTAMARRSSPSPISDALVPGLVFAGGFSVLFALTNTSGLALSTPIYDNIKLLRILSGVAIIACASYMPYTARKDYLEGGATKTLVARTVLALTLGAAFALVYMPCITPTLSRIMNFAMRPAEAAAGTLMAGAYGLGMGLAFTLSGLVLVSILSRIGIVKSYAGAVAAVAMLVLAALGVLNISGYMVNYKAFVLGTLTGGGM